MRLTLTNKEIKEWCKWRRVTPLVFDTNKMNLMVPNHEIKGKFNESSHSTYDNWHKPRFYGIEFKVYMPWEKGDLKYLQLEGINTGPYLELVRAIF